MTASYPCNERNYIGRAGQDRITYAFVTSDGVTPSACVIRMGDTDPLTGETLPEELFREYHQIRNQEVYRSNKADRVPWSKEEKEERKKERGGIARAFQEEYGYAPEEETIDYLLDDRWGCRYNIHLDACVNECGECAAERCLHLQDPYAENEFIGNEADEITMLHEFAATLSDRLLDVYQLMLEKYAGGAGARMGKDVARKWGVSPAMIVKDEKKLVRMLKEFRTSYELEG